MNKEIAFKCLECGTINVYPDKRGDGNSCIKCGGIITPIGEPVVYQPRLTYQSSKKNEISINIKVDTTELDVALDKARELQDIVNNMPGEDNTNGEKKDNPAKNIKTTLLPIGYINCNKINNLLYKMMKK